ncbi:hypothetical protein D9M68_701330 [compost metagenome]
MLLVGAAALDAGQVGARCAKLGLGAGRIQVGGLAGVVALLQQLQRVFTQPDGRVQQVAFAVERAQREIRLRHVGLQRELHRAVQVLRCLAIGARGIDAGRHASEQVELIAGEGACLQHGLRRDPRAVGQALRRGRRLRAGRIEAHAELRVEIRLGRAGEGARLLQPGRGNGEILVGFARGGHQAVQLAVAEDLPPFAAMLAFRRRRGLPLRAFGLRGLGFLVGRHRGGLRHLVGRGQRAAGQDQGGGQRCNSRKLPCHLGNHLCIP